MRCLLCGNPISVLQKLSTTEFCCADHRNSFIQEHQRSVRSRLAESAARLEAARARAANKPKRTVEEPDPSFAPFRFSLFSIQDRVLGLRWMEAAPPMDFPPAFPVHEFTLIGGSVATVLIADLPWPRYNPGLWYFHHLEPDDKVAHSHLIQWLNLTRIQARPGWVLAAMLPGRRPDIKVARRAALIAADPEWMEGWAPVPVWDSLRFPAPDVRANQLLRRERPFSFRPRGLAPVARECKLLVEPVAAQSTTRHDLRLPLPPRTHRDLGLFDRFYRMRPRAGVLAPSLQASIAIAAEPVFQPLAILTASAQPAVMRECSPGAVHRFFRPRPRGPLASASEATWLAIPAEPIPVPAQCITPASPAVAGAAPQIEDRTVETRPQAAVASPLVRVFEQNEVPVPAPLVPPAARPHLDVAEAETAPKQIDRPFRMRVRVASAGGAAQGEATAESFVSVPCAAVLPAVAGDCVPKLLERLFRPRPRVGVPDGGLSDLRHASTAAEPLISRPCPAVLPATAPECAPLAVGRLFRLRPSAGVPDTKLADVKGGTACAEPLVSRPCKATYPAITPNHAPLTVDRFFRPRPRAGVPDSTLTDLQQSSTQPELLVSRPWPAVLCAIVPECVPPAIHRLFRPRPRAGVPDSKLADLQRSCTVAEPLVSRPCRATLPAMSPDCAPLAVDRLFRPRPRAGVPDSRLADLQRASVLAEPLASRPCQAVLPVTAGDCAPLAIEKLFRPRPRAGVPDSRLADLQQASVLAEPLASRPCQAVLPATAGDCAPRAIDKLFRPRPRAGVPDGTLATHHQVSAPAEPLVSRPHEATFPATATDCAPNPIDRLCRPRPRVADSDLKSAPQTAAPAETLLSAPQSPALSSGANQLTPAECTRLVRTRPRDGASDGFRLERIESEPQMFALRPTAMTQSLPDPEARRVHGLFRLRPRPADFGAKTDISCMAPLSFPGESCCATFGPDALGSLAPAFLNRLFRMRPRFALDDPSTTMQRIRCKHLMIGEPEPLLATMPADAIVAGPALVDRLYRMRPRNGRDCENKSKVIVPAPLAATRSDRRTPQSPVSGLRDFAVTLMLPVEAVDFS